MKLLILLVTLGMFSHAIAEVVETECAAINQTEGKVVKTSQEKEKEASSIAIGQ